MKLTVDTWYEVGPITQDNTGKPVFPQLPEGGGMYRFAWPDGRIYIGQTGTMRSRMGGYRSWNKRHTHAELFDALRDTGGTVSIITAATLDGQPVDMSRRDAREMVEGFLRYTQRPTLNKDR
ncbi:hypothetical protein [Ruegeria arenilitoris]|uniref:hypothetical protein n=1 Tax=Ruegeria arenilitoris TaxID=1173585 RepID=UPI00147CDDCF|nr:hypothetical protein [Ruegeria arenilitoris]